jgi:REP element-mobilizing transposase RayT
MAIYFITFTCYGTWLHGDKRGSHDRKTHQQFAPDPALEAQMRLRMNHPPFELTGPMRKTVREAIIEHCGFKAWMIHELNVRTNHVHLVVSAEASASRVLNAVKAYATRALREAGLVDAGRPVWTERGSKSSLETEEDFQSACAYVRDGQGPDLPDD